MTDDCMGCRVPGYSHAAYCPEGRVEDLRSRLAEAERDAARYRWLRDQFRLLNADMGGNHAWSFGHIARLRGPSVDAAIDAAMGEKP